MGLDAYVYCRCLEDGLSPAPPVPVYMDEEDGLLPVDDADYDVLEEWLESACEHPGMRLVFERINNWAGVHVFQEALRRMGPEQFPTLLAEIPDANGGSTTAEASAMALEELEEFRRADAAWARPVLLDEKDELLSEYIASHGGLFMFAAGLQAGLSDEGLFFIQTEDGNRLFTSSEFTQEVELPRAKFQDAAMGLTFEGELVLKTPDPPVRYPSRLRVELRPKSSDEFGFTVDALTSVFSAAVSTRSRVYWW
jgi:hypothetical protein